CHGRALGVCQDGSVSLLSPWRTAMTKVCSPLRAMVVLVAASALWLPIATTRAAQDKNLDARQVAEAYVAAALLANAAEAAALAEPGQSPAGKERIQEFKELVGAKALKLVSVHATDTQGRALAVSEPVRLTKANPNGQDKGALLFTLKKVDGKWLVR